MSRLLRGAVLMGALALGSGLGVGASAKADGFGFPYGPAGGGHHGGGYGGGYGYGRGGGYGYGRGGGYCHYHRRHGCGCRRPVPPPVIAAPVYGGQPYPYPVQPPAYGGFSFGFSTGGYGGYPW